MSTLNGIEELIRADCDKMIHNLTQIKKLHNLTSDESEFKKAKQLYKENKEIALRLQKLEYKEEHILPIVKKKALYLLEKARNEVKKD